MTSLIRSSDANRSSLSLRCDARPAEGVSVDSEARSRTGVGAADLAVLGLNRSCSRARQREVHVAFHRIGRVSSRARSRKGRWSRSVGLKASNFGAVQLTVLVSAISPLPTLSNSAFHSAPFLTGACSMISGLEMESALSRWMMSESVMAVMVGYGIRANDGRVTVNCLNGAVP